MYRELIENLTRENPWVQIQPPCTEAEIQKAEQFVGWPFPAELRKLLLELNGDNWCVLSAQGIMENVQRNREIFLPMFESDFSREAYEDRVGRFLFFATNGCGDYYGYRADTSGTLDDSTIYYWNHEDLGEDCCWKMAASSVAELLTRYYHDEI